MMIMSMVVIAGLVIVTYCHCHLLSSVYRPLPPRIRDSFKTNDDLSMALYGTGKTMM
jgi:hypothetical protein